MDLHWKLYVKLCPVLHSDGKTLHHNSVWLSYIINSLAHISLSRNKYWQTDEGCMNLREKKRFLDAFFRI